MDNMRSIRKKKGYTMKALGKAVGVSESTISLYENGKHEPDIVTMRRIADVLNVTVDELLGREQKDPATAGGMDDALMDLLVGLPPDDVQRVRDFVAGLKAARTV